MGSATLYVDKNTIFRDDRAPLAVPRFDLHVQPIGPPDRYVVGCLDDELDDVAAADDREAGPAVRRVRGDAADQLDLGIDRRREWRRDVYIEQLGLDDLIDRRPARRLQPRAEVHAERGRFTLGDLP